MTLAELRERAEQRSAKLSDICRQLSLAGLALVWVFRSGDGAQATISPALARIALIFVVSLGLDALQYLYAYGVFEYEHRRLEKRGMKPDDPVPGVHPKTNWPTIGFFGAKLATAGVGYAMLLTFLLRHVH